MPKSKSEAPAGSVHVEPADAVQQARTRARHRLIGAVVLLLIGIIGFPLVFETAPRPIPIDTPIEIPPRDAMPPLLVPAARPNGEPTPASGPVATPTRAPHVSELITESAAEAGRDVTPASAASTVVASTASRSVATAASAASLAPVVATASATPPAAAATPRGASASAPADDGARALALLEGRAGAASAASRFVVQAGAFADADGARDVRRQLERLGLKTYLQVIDSAAGKRVYRVRLGPFTARAEADAALAKARAAGIDAAVITL